jgi:leader peptidase (prepilin peptidase)/N-methyltransferase
MEQLPQLTFYPLTALFGLLIGSFLNVVILRLPQNMSLGGRSQCPHCGQKIAWYHLMPVLSYFILRGRSACCDQKISAQYPLVEFLTMLLALMTFHHVSPPMEAMLWFLLFICPLIVLSFIDASHMIIPDVITLPGIIIGIHLQMYLQWPDAKSALFSSLGGTLVGGGLLLILAEVFSRFRGKDALGGGDIKLTAMLGAFLGIQALPFIFFVSSALGILFTLGKVILKKQKASEPLPFGPFLALAGLMVFFYQQAFLMK